MRGSARIYGVRVDTVHDMGVSFPRSRICDACKSVTNFSDILLSDGTFILSCGRSFWRLFRVRNFTRRLNKPDENEEFLPAVAYKTCKLPQSENMGRRGVRPDR